jgi:hypothetical protein
LKFPGNLLTVPDIGRSQWSQIIRMFFSSPSKGAHKRGRAITLITSHATNQLTNGNANILKDPNEMDIEHAPKYQVEDLEHVKMKGRSDARSE